MNHKFQRGINRDLNAHELPGNQVRDAVNVSLFEMEQLYNGTPIPGTVEKVYSGIDDTKVLATISCHGTVFGARTRGTAYFFHSPSTNASWISFHDHDTTLYTLFPSILDATKNELGFTGDTDIDVDVFDDNEHTTLYFTSKEGGYKKINVMVDGSYPTIDQLDAQNKHPLDPIKLSAILTDGSLHAGMYQIMYRYWDSTSCRHSAWSFPTSPIPIIPDGEGFSADFDPTLLQVYDNWGGRIGAPTNKKIQLSIDTNIGSSGYDSIQLLAIPSLTDSKVVSSNGYIYSPSKAFYDDPSSIVIASTEGATLIDVSSILVDKLPLKGASTITIKDETVFLGDIQIHEFAPQDLSHNRMFTIEREVGDVLAPYKKEKVCHESRSYFRGELYPFGIFIYDEYGRGIVCPLDTSSYNASAVYMASYDSYTTNSYDGTHSRLGISEAFGPGDLIRIDGTEYVVLQYDGASILIEGSPPVAGSIDLLYGQMGNQGSSWAWRFPDRSSSKYTIINENNQVTALGLRVEGLRNWPSWAKGFFPVRMDRVKDIIYQTPHIPAMGVRGVPTPYVYSANKDEPVPALPDYQKGLDHLVPKVFRMGAARNIYKYDTIVSMSEGVGSKDYQLTESRYVVQDDTDPIKEVPRLTFLTPPAYLRNFSGESYFVEDNIAGYNVNIVDAALLRMYSRVNELPEHSGGYTGAYSGYNKRANVIGATNRSEYFYNREGIVEENGQEVFQKKIEDLDGFTDVANTKVDYNINLEGGSAKQVLPHSPFSEAHFVETALWGASGELAAQQVEHPSVSSEAFEIFNTSVNNQKGIIAGTRDKIKDFTLTMAHRRIDNNDNYFPLDSWVINPNIVYPSTGFDNGETIPLSVSSSDAVANTDVCGATYILNITRGLGDDRYGDIKNNQGAWRKCGDPVPLSEDDITNNTPFDVEIFGGDCFITRHSTKVSESTPRPSPYDVYDDEATQTPSGSTWSSKTGAHRYDTEVLEVILESEINGAYAPNEAHYPAEEKGWFDTWSYDYHPGYSKGDILKTFLSKQDFCIDTANRPNALIWSESRVRGGVSTAITDVDGFDEFLVSNIKILDGKFGSVTKILDLGDKALHVLQQSRVAYIPIGVNEIQSLDGQVLTTGTGNLLGSGDFYLQKNLGSGELHASRVWDGMAYVVDSIRKVVYRFGSRGAAFDELSWKGVDYFCDTFLDSDQIITHIDSVRDRFFVQRRDSNEALVYNIKQNAWETRLDIQPFWGHSDEDKAFWFAQGKIYRAYEGDKSVYFGTERTSSIEVVCNEGNVTKVLQVLEVNSNGNVSFDVQVFDGLSDPIYEAGPFTTKFRNGRYYANTLRYKAAGGRSQKLAGDYFVIRAVFTGNVSINEIISTVRRRF